MGIYTLTSMAQFYGTGQAQIIKDPSDPFGPRFYNWETMEFQDTPPSDVQLGKEVGFYVIGQNISSSTLRLRLEGKVIGPDGSILSTESNEVDVDPGSFIGLPNCMAVTFEGGTYKGRAELYSSGELVDSWEGKIGTVPGGGIATWPLVVGGLGVLAAGAIIGMMLKK